MSGTSHVEDAAASTTKSVADSAVAASSGTDANMHKDEVTGEMVSKR